MCKVCRKCLKYQVLHKKHATSVIFFDYHIFVVAVWGLFCLFCWDISSPDKKNCSKAVILKLYAYPISEVTESS